ncbi:tRNA pseudouridine(13) synthase TruD [Aliiglaciecola sp. 2_MG-2023]|uniref:tRNA pseudouridine(13) synthase TruD n=1 Tax=unclassified Aliiglaciecola TaxID=2593648 RepID=UPI0026E1272A|nr:MULTISPECIES: tRNA pseudouridine(13) synthase TruD [unclassified Aliiglaciecola]MDO6711326.1 tRNA pseudouridine(13) synthase TruD [Aliiglaciecola sp. 2_MG-2023]MDO6752225.1 tRNA pseudouridine(13) synthase TruD [Aliiglaciecola sp. 1_MG-2023]
MIALGTEHWLHQQSAPTASGTIKSSFADFVVREELGYELTGEGEHIHLWVQKEGLNTAFVAEQLAKFCGLPLRAITYAGRKDKHALTQQWFGVHAPGKQTFEWQDLQLDGLRILESQRHNKKLRVGALTGNRFELVVREITDTSQLTQRLEYIQQNGVPNYFGAQRFGESRHHQAGGNLLLAQTMLNGETIRNRNKRSMAISALRSWLFNEFIHQRLLQKTYATPLPGEACILTGSNSFFIARQIDPETRLRLEKNDIVLSAPMWGTGELTTEGQVKEFEQQVAKQQLNVCQLLAALGLKQERRAICLKPQNLQWQISSDTLNIQFSLPAGCFATSVLRELINANTAEQ